MSNKNIPTSNWGPYSNNSIGICRTYENGSMLCMTPFCGRVSRRVILPQMKYANDEFFVIEALPDLSYYHFRYKLEFDASVYIDARYYVLDEETAVIEFQYVNNGNRVEFLQSNIVVNTECVPSRLSITDTNENIFVYGAEKYRSIDFLKSKWLAENKYGVFNDNLAINGKTLSFDLYRGTDVQWEIPICSDEYKYFRIRYSLRSDKSCSAVIKGNNSDVVFNPSGGEYLLTDYLETQDSNLLDVKFASCSPYLKLDSFIFYKCKSELSLNHSGLEGTLSNISYDQLHTEVKFDIPELQAKYSVNSDSFYPPTKVAPSRFCYKLPDLGKEIHDFDKLLSIMNFMPFKEQVWPCKFLVLGSKVEELNPGQKTKHKFVISSNHDLKNTVTAPDVGFLQDKYKQYSDAYFGGKFKDFAEHLAAQTFCNVSYPQFVDGKPVKYNTPAKHYGSLYLWDMGMVGIGISNLSLKNAKALFNQYLCEKHCDVPFISWGTMLPIHIFLYWNIFNRENDKGFLTEYYDKIIRMYDFFTGVDSKSAMRDRETNLINNFKYFYNSGGWDDYPAQQLANKIGREEVYPVICTCQIILAAKIMLMVSKLIGKNDNVKKFESDIKIFEKALEQYHWNPKQNIYSYYDKINKQFLSCGDQEPNMGLDGYYPLVSSSIDLKRADKFTDTLFDDKHIWTDYGLTTVDKSSIYFDPEGYWNGHVWPAHNWFYWKALLDYGFSGKARLLADALLCGFEREFTESGVVFEYLRCQTGRGQGAPYFSGLTAPLLDIYMAYYGGKDEKATGGFLVYPRLKKDGDNYKLEVFSASSLEKTSLILRVKPDTDYVLVPVANSKEKDISFSSDSTGIAEILINVVSECSAYNIISK